MALKLPLKIISSTILAAGLLVATPGLSQENPVVAKVGDREITKADLSQATQRLQQQFANIPADQRQARVLDALIDFSVLAKQAENAGIDKDPEIARTMEYLRVQALHNAYFTKKIQPTITDEKLKQRYEKQTADAKPEKEVHARHILVKTEEEAKAIIKELDGGADFIELAKAKSTGPSGPQGGDLGFFGKGRMVPEFEKAAFSMKAGEYTKEPVKTQFGYHVLKVDETRDKPLPTFEASKAQLQQVMLSEAYAAAVKEGRAALKVEIMDDKLKLPAASK